MKIIRNKLIALLCIAVAFPYPGSSQDSLTQKLRFEVNRIYPYISITKKELNEAHTLTDLNSRYQSSWVREYISVEVFVNYKGSIRKAVSKNDTLSQEQIHIMNMSDVGKDISVKIQYIPENTLMHNDSKEITFTFAVNPESDAKYSGGQQQLNKYLKDNAIDKIPNDCFKEYDLSAVKFTIDEAGQIIDAHVFGTSKDKQIDDLLLETICNMPGWKPAEYSNGTKIKQEFVLTVGNMENCVVPLLNIHQN